jgi:hypothetical protein
MYTYTHIPFEIKIHFWGGTLKKYDYHQKEIKQLGAGGSHL